ncbi:MAG: hypothetical protein WCE75_06305 [Terracidiphilus sp.]
MSDGIPFSIVASQDGYTARLGWISSATGITYCGICLGPELEPREGVLCARCRACVVGVFDTHSDHESIRRAWSRAIPSQCEGLPLTMAS